jgi:hypothetical protein
MPEDSVEQRVNAAAIARLGIGVRVEHSRLRAEDVRRFLRRDAELRDRTRWHLRDGRAEAIAALQAFLDQLAPRTRPAAALARTA